MARTVTIPRLVGRVGLPCDSRPRGECAAPEEDRVESEESSSGTPFGSLNRAAEGAVMVGGGEK